MPGCFSSLIPRRRNSSQVEKEMDEKPEKSLDLPPSYSSISNEALTILEGTIDSLSKGLRALSLDIWNHPELKLEVGPRLVFVNVSLKTVLYRSIILTTFSLNSCKIMVRQILSQF